MTKHHHSSCFAFKNHLKIHEIPLSQWFSPCFPPVFWAFPGATGDHPGGFPQRARPRGGAAAPGKAALWALLGLAAGHADRGQSVTVAIDLWCPLGEDLMGNNRI